MAGAESSATLRQPPLTPRRLLLIIALGAAELVAFFAVQNLSSSAVYYLTPSEARDKHIGPGTAVRLGGLVVPGTLHYDPQSRTLVFAIGDGTTNIAALGYSCLHRSADAANYVRGSEGIDFLYAHRPLARELLAQASERDTPMGRLRVISVEGLIGFKLQGFVNDASRTRDLDDIRALMQVHRNTLNVEELQRYFALFEKTELLDDLLK